MKRDRRANNWRRNLGISVVVGLLLVATLVQGCSAGEVTTGVCSEGEVIDEYRCENREWVLYEGPCLEIDCGAEAVCAEIDGDARCECDEGFEVEGLSCVAVDEEEEEIEETPGPCEDINCGTHGQCVEVGDEAECDCLEGYIDENWICIPEEIDPCEDFNCGPNGACVASGEFGSCECNPGYVAESDYCISETSPCDGVSCSGNGACEGVGGNPQCNCNAGFVAQGLECIPEPPECTGASECAVYILYEGEDEYMRVDYEDTGFVDALDGPIVAAFDIDDSSRGYILTESSYYRINTANFALLRTGPLSDLHPDIADRSSLEAAYSTPVNEPRNDNVAFIANPSNSTHGEALAFVYQYSNGAFLEHDPHRGWFEVDEWTQDVNEYLVPDTSDTFSAQWLDMENARGFAQGDPGENCGGGLNNTEGIPYFGVMTQNQIHYIAATNCFPFVHAETHNSAPIFQDFANAPDPDDVGAAFWHNGGLYLFTGAYYD